MFRSWASDPRGRKKKEKRREKRFLKTGLTVCHGRSYPIQRDGNRTPVPCSLLAFAVLARRVERSRRVRRVWRTVGWTFQTRVELRRLCCSPVRRRGKIKSEVSPLRDSIRTPRSRQTGKTSWQRSVFSFKGRTVTLSSRQASALPGGTRPVRFPRAE